MLLLLGLAATMVLGLSMRRPELVAPGAIGLALCSAVLVVVASTPTNGLINVIYTLRWISPAGMVVWIAAGWSAFLLAKPLLQTRTARPGKRTAWAAAGVLAAIATAVLVRSAPLDQPYRQARLTSDRLVAALPEHSSTRVDAPLTSALFMTAHLQGGLVYALRHAGRGVSIDANAALGFGKQYANRPFDHLAELIVDQPSNGSGELVSRVRAPDPFEHATRTVEMRLSTR